MSQDLQDAKTLRKEIKKLQRQLKQSAVSRSQNTGSVLSCSSPTRD